MIMSFKQRMQYLDEVKRKNKDMSQHPNGTYMSATLSKKSQTDLDKWVAKNNIPNPADPKQYHSTIIYSRKGIPEAKNYKIPLPMSAKIKEWKIFPTQSGDKCLVAIMDSPEMERHHKYLRSEYGATHDYPDYHPHVTISYDYGDLPVPANLPDLKLEYDDTEFKPLDPDFVPPKKDTR
jgi:2'-5' RNA ligase